MRLGRATVQQWETCELFGQLYTKDIKKKGDKGVPFTLICKSFPRLRTFAMDGVRRAFRFSKWKPTSEQWTLAAQCVQPEEKERIGRFVFQKDAKSAMVSELEQ